MSELGSKAQTRSSPAVVQRQYAAEPRSEAEEQFKPQCGFVLGLR